MPDDFTFETSSDAQFDINGDLAIEALIDVDRLQELFNAFHAATGLAASIISLDGQILVGAGWRRICTDFHRKSPAAAQLCTENDTRMHAELLRGRREAIYKCPHGLMDAAVPILISDRHMANLFSGQFLLTPPNSDTLTEFKQRAATFGFDEAAYLDALHQTPVVPERQVTHILQYLKRLAEMIGELGLNQLRLKARERALVDAHADLKNAVRKQAQETRWLGQTIEGNPIPTFVINAQCKVTHWNHACELLTGIAAADIIGTDHHREAFYSQRRRIMADLIVENASVHQVAMLYGKKFRGSHQVEDGYEGEDFFPKLGKYGRWLFFTAAPIKDADGRIIGAIETIQDITARRIAEQELRASEARYHQLFETANDAILIMKNGVILECNQQALNLTGVSRRQLIGRTPLDFSPEIQPNGVSSRETLMEKTAGVYQDLPQVFEWRMRSADGHDVDVEVGVTRFMIGGDPHGLAIIRDVTERKQMVRELEERERELQEKTRYLEKVNQALKASLDHREIEKRSVEEHLLINLKRLVHPYLEELQQCRLDGDAEAYVNIITTHLGDLTAQASKTLSAKYMDLTPTEIRVADLIRSGKNTKEIANLMGLSPSSIQWHRKNLRQKLGLTNRKINLNTFLTSISD